MLLSDRNQFYCSHLTQLHHFSWVCRVLSFRLIFGSFVLPDPDQYSCLSLLRYVSKFGCRSHFSQKADNRRRESFETIYLDLSKQPGKCKLAESGLGWRPAGGGDTFTLDSNNIGAAQWSRAAKGYELKILSRSSGVIQLDGFEQEVSPWTVTKPPSGIFF
jgi:POB3-like N-terminal PH domain